MSFEKFESRKGVGDGSAPNGEATPPAATYEKTIGPSTPFATGASEAPPADSLAWLPGHAIPWDGAGALRTGATKDGHGCAGER